MTTKDDVMMNDDHVIKCSEGTNTGNHGNSRTSNPPPAVFTLAKEIINEGMYVEGLCILMRFYYMKYLLHEIRTMYCSWRILRAQIFCIQVSTM